MSNGLVLINRAIAFCRRVGGRTISNKTRARYVKTFVRLWRGDLDPLKPGIARDTYGHNKAALYAISALWVGRLSTKCYEAVERKDLRAAKRWARLLHRVLDRLEPAIARDPPPPQGQSPLKASRSRWQLADAQRPKRGANSKRHLLGRFPRNWQSLVWQAADRGYKYRAELAIMILIPIRTVEMTAGNRGGVWSPGVVIEKRSARSLSVTVARAKTRDGKFGAPWIEFEFDPITAGEPARYLASLCEAAGGRAVIALRSTETFRKSISALAKTALPDTKEDLSPIVFRHQTIADYKATFGAGEMVAAAAGQITDRSQARYGYVCHGCKKEGILAIRAATPPKIGNVARAHSLRKPRPKNEDI